MGSVETKLGRRVAELRATAGLTQAQLAERVGVATETVSRLERGATLPSLAKIEALAAALGVELADLFRRRARTTARDAAMDRLLAALRGRPAEDVELLADIAGHVFARWPSAKRPGSS
jgi:transcriptional regulator with XRE-family HTH domain